jgi:threonine synthase
VTTPASVLYRCYLCHGETAVDVARVTCDCGGVLDLPVSPPAPPPATGAARFPDPQTLVADWALERSSLGVGPTPLVRWRDGADVWLKCDHLLPTGSFKDRGAEVITGLAVELGADEVVVDSSGNAAAALAAHAARAGLRCTAFVPAGTSSNKLRQIAAYGARLELVRGPREAAAAAARTFAGTHDALYASHAMNPYFHDGTKSWLYEVIAQLPQARTLVLPAGSGSLLLGVLRGLEELVRSGWITHPPKLIIAQAAGYASLSALPDASAAQGSRVEPPLAEGIAISRPARRQQILDQLTVYDATVCVVDNAAILDAQRELAVGGFYVEPTSAAAWAAWRGQPTNDCTVVALTGHGLKAMS